MEGHYIMQNASIKKITAWIALAAVLFVMLFSITFISQHADHECTGDECPVCAVMEMCGAIIKNLEVTVAVVAAAVFLVFSIRNSVQLVAIAGGSCSLVSQKIRMNN